MGSTKKCTFAPLVAVAVTAAVHALGTVCALPEGALAATIRVDQGGGGDYHTIQAGIAAANEGDTILVAAGTYTGPANRDLDFAGVNVSLLAEDGPGTVVLDCQGAGRGFHLHSGEDTTAVVTGLTVVDGYSADRGGGLYFDGASPKFVSCSFLECRAGGASSGLGGGAFVDASEPRFVDCTFRECEAYDAGGMFCYNAPAVLTGCLFIDNNAIHGGGGIRILAQPAVLRGCTFVRNTAPTFGGAVFCCYSSPIIENCTFWENDAAQGGGIYGYDASPTITNCIVAGSPTGSGLFCPGTGSFAVSYSCIFGNAGGDSPCGDAGNNIYDDPAFCDPEADNLRLQDCSPCLDAGQGGSHIGAWGAGCMCGEPTGVEVDEGDGTRPRLAVFPNPTRDGAFVRYLGPISEEAVHLAVYGVRGDVVRTLATGRPGPGTHEIRWDGRDEGGRRVAAGVYFVRLLCAGAAREEKLILLR
jgi:hypothetical protein